MVALEAMRSANEAFKNSAASKDLVGLFVGATSGIAEHTLKSFAKYTNSPRIYFVGRNKTAAERVQNETLAINPSATVTFIPTQDLTSLAATDEVAEQFLKHEKKLDVLVMSSGYLTMAGRDENAEGLDRKMTINYYGRMRLLGHLLPTLRSAATNNSSSSSSSSSSAFPPHVISIFGTGSENADTIREQLKKNNLDLSAPDTFTLRNCTAVTVTGNSLALEQFAIDNPNVTFAHVSPGFVSDTGMMRDMPAWARGTYKIAKPLMGLLGNKATDVGEGIAWLAFGGRARRDGNLYLGDWKGERIDFREAKRAGCRDQKEWDKEREGLRRGMWKQLGEVMGKVKSEGLRGVWDAEV
ncbi:hypothetical protein BDZ91DRAFT_703280 [Kalaharituber pfeilii]|nr:hypothetical protein BDZ91DRAFT_703280 [Kalaharituber pfeilii]